MTTVNFLLIFLCLFLIEVIGIQGGSKGRSLPLPGVYRTSIYSRYSDPRVTIMRRQENPYSHGSGNYGPSYKDPGLSVQTGYEGFLVPNPWNGILPWSADIIVIVIIVVLVILVFKAAIIYLWIKVFKLGKLLKENIEDGRTILHSERFSNLTTEVLGALDKFNEIK